ncbi:hypothetical protein [Acidithiobacillus ferriphilus]|uniref:hypothetical protein n=1 Tax=Acidithiobacillus ferriphilus TaxID=1689834 RepID=UPI001C078145|nr:hypothetical protein [Acidithiobacillus ferriphilus]
MRIERLGFLPLRSGTAFSNTFRDASALAALQSANAASRTHDPYLVSNCVAVFRTQDATSRKVMYLCAMKLVKTGMDIPTADAIALSN